MRLFKKKQNIVMKYPVAKPAISFQEKQYLREVIDSGWISSSGPFIERLEEAFARAIGTKYAVACSSGTAALTIALRALGIGEGDEVIVPEFTMVASAWAVTYTGAKPVFVDCGDDLNIDVSLIEAAITSNTRAIMPVHIYGRPCAMKEIKRLAYKHNLYIVEDACEAHGADIDGRKVGSFGDMGCFSFYGNKIITTGEGGMVVTHDKSLMEKMKMLRDHGQDPKRRYYHPVIGFYYRLTNIQAALGCAQLERIEEFIRKKRTIAHYYTRLLSSISGIKTPVEKEWARSVFWMYSILIEKDSGKTRDQVMHLLEREGIETRPFFIPLHTLPFYRTKEQFPNATYLSHSGLNLPSSVTLKEEQIRSIVSCIKKFA